ncbi:MAG: response regulator transcription factor [Oscillospiraceae bacterium]|nr:response regulator transcription factor [Oscillospiraceae bacterium]
MKILILDDEPAISGFVNINLRRAGHETVVAETGEDALTYLAGDPDIDIALLDVMLPGIDGFEVCRRIRAMGRNVGVIMLSAKSQEADKVNGLMLGADDYVPKPFSITELLARIESLARRIGAASRKKPLAGSITAGEFRLDLDAHQLFRGGEEIPLTQLEFQILRLFLERQDKPLAREELLTQIWGREYAGDDKVVDVNVRRLRMKVEDDPAAPRHLVAVWGYGYKWRN